MDIVTEGKCPVDHAVMQKLYAEHGPVQNELREMVEPLAEALATQIEVDTNEWDPVSTWVSSNEDVISSGLPYSDDVDADPYTLPPHLFGDTSDTLAFTIPKGYDDRSEAAKQFIKERPQPRARYATLTDEWLQDNLALRLGQVRRSEEDLDLDKWSRYVDVANEQLGGYFHLEAASHFRHTNAKRMLEAKPGLIDLPEVSRFDSYMYRSTDTLWNGSTYNSAPTGYLFMPIGEYGPEFAEKLLNTTLYAIERAGIACSELADQLAEGHEEVISTHMARGREKDEGRTPGGALLSSLQEGALSIGQTIALLTAEKVEGYDDPVQLTRAIVDNGLIEQFTRAVPMGLVGPFVFSGRYFSNIIQKTETGLRLNPDIMAIVKTWRMKQVGEFVTRWEDYNKKIAAGEEDTAPSALGVPCPGAFAHGAVANVGKAMVTALEGIGKAPSKQRAHVGRRISRTARPVAALLA